MPQETAIRNFLILLALTLSACARPVFEAPQAATDLTPAAAAADIQAALERRVVWGGRIVAARNLADRTELVVLGFPLDRGQRPRTRERPVGRFIVHYPGYLETGVYAPDRLVTIDGRVVARETRPVGEASYRYAMASARAIHLWPEGEDRGPDVRFGVGIGIHN